MEYMLFTVCLNFVTVYNYRLQLLETKNFTQSCNFKEHFSYLDKNNPQNIFIVFMVRNKTRTQTLIEKLSGILTKLYDGA